ncbi:MAG: methylated-DNA--[protein]-cysteine S-methyltransferase [Planctomycetes bacterium]|nr:methylated-DNA--[protein]-cysteine S-methyltransferase [Planctomycetota bacterium]
MLGKSDSLADILFSTFSTPLGWIGLAGTGQTLLLVSIGHRSQAALKRAIAERLRGPAGTPRLTLGDWHPDLRQRLERYCTGKVVDFSDVAIYVDDQTPFARAVLEAVRGIPYSQTRTYGDIADQVGRPRAARAVGRIMAANRFPLVIPCHRVVAADGGLGGFSAPQGIRLKQRLLQMEAAGTR